MYVMILVCFIFLSLSNIDSAPFNQTTEETTNGTVLNDMQTESTGMKLTDKARKYQTTLTLLDLIYDNC